MIQHDVIQHAMMYYTLLYSTLLYSYYSTLLYSSILDSFEVPLERPDIRDHRSLEFILGGPSSANLFYLELATPLGIWTPSRN